MLILCGHSHWINQVKYNPAHDELLLTCSSDGLVNLWDLPSVASKPMDVEMDEFDEIEKEEEEKNKENEKKEEDEKKLNVKDSLIQSIDEHEESVYSLTWSSKNPWVFASASYGGRILIHNTPSIISSRILSL